MTSLYRKILSQSLKMVWRKKYLWFFGLFAIILTGSDADFEIFNRFFGDKGQSVFSPLQIISNTNLFTAQGMGKLVQFFQTDPLSAISGVLILLIILILVLFVIWLTVVSQSALVKNTANIIASKENNFQSGVMAGIDNFWAVLGINILNKTAIAVAAFLIAYPVSVSFLSSHPVISSLSYLIMFLIMVPVALSISFLLKYAIAFRVIKGDDIISSIKKGAMLFVNNWLISLEMAITLFFINFIATFLIAIGFLMLIGPLYFLSLVAASFSFALLSFVQILAFVLLVVLSGICVSILAVFQVSSWTGLYIELINRGGTSKIVRVIDKVLN